MLYKIFSSVPRTEIESSDHPRLSGVIVGRDYQAVLLGDTRDGRALLSSAIV